ncbi:MAG: putative chemoreceptor glutamine deamidase CheD 3 [Nitrospira sp.]|nr:MAG: putative chemoreceptor glutamine deamidase CheD 3 [Nitrospira sp.]
MSKPRNLSEVFLRPGEFHFGHANTRIKTILGSCVAITMWHPVLRIGGMCHYLLPAREKEVSGELDGRYGMEALQLFVREMARRATAVQEYEVKIFGGGNMFPSFGKKGPALEIGARNIELAREAIEKLGVTPVAQHVGDIGHRHVIFDVWSGNVWVKHQRLNGATRSV